MLILVVDDQPLNCRLLTAMLEQQHYDVLVANNGQEALTLLHQHEVDIVLLDVMMPVMNGFETAPKIKEYAGDVYLPIIFITALEDHASFEKCLRVGGDDFIHKPFDRIILSAKIRAHARTRKLSKEANEQKKLLEYHYNQTEREHEIVEHIFRNALSGQEKFDSLCDFHLSPASMFNGDMFLMAKSPIGGFYCLLGDFTGHGLAAAVGALPASRIFYTMVQKGMAVGDIATELNSSLYTLLPGHMFCAAAIIELSSSGKNISAWLGGLPDVYLVNEQGRVLKTVESQHMALGILDDDEFERTILHFEVDKGTRLVMATDGIIESEGPDGEMFGEGRFIDTLQSTPAITTQEVIDKVRNYAQHAEQQDDLSIAIINCLPAELEHSGETHYSSLPFEVNVSLDAEQMKVTDPVLEVVNVLSNVEGVDAHRSNIFLLLSEAYNNSLDHGVLGISSELKNQEDGFLEYYTQRADALSKLTEATIEIAASYSPEKRSVTFDIKDSGRGFSQPELPSDSTLSNEHGRGVQLLSEIADSVSYNRIGNEVKLVYSLD
ncbi:SpoIIE family protein phosphatase [Pseudoalteromonas luteoviolacea]|uniref:SpoIIE family protein phosphatase n=1 Tax=Pseudoalteromonas luteoviolacea TaxID=43657 RepID=UPI001EEE4473|nr:SpoIIE family protein phosphatase [Pseudoalteromonas luteoviolacea]MCF6438297.1 SpoIIE family protein phosphatase [Pseudoalteromonas luteoviolacea]